jgi:acyl-coenzyme A thioesterase PaaI-like protein
MSQALTVENANQPSQHGANRLQRLLAKIDRVPVGLRTWVRSKALGRAVPLTGTASMRYEVMTPTEVVISVANARHVRNHIGGVHAMASTLAAETATGMLMGLNVRDDCVNVVKDMRVQFVKRGQGAMRAVATLTDAQRQLISSTMKGETVVPVTVTDDSGNQPILCEFTWAWIPAKR